MIFGTVINPELQDEIVVTVIATGFEDKPTSQGRKLQVLVSEQVQLQALQHKQVRQKNHSLKLSRSSESVSERSHTTKDDDIPSFIRNREERRSRKN